MNRRRFLNLLGTTPLLYALPGRAQKMEATHLMPDEGELHAATWMAYGATASAWGTSGSYGASRTPARRDLMRIALNLSRFEAVKMLVSTSDLVQAQQFLVAAKLEAQKSGAVFSGDQALPGLEAGGPISLIPRGVNDLWVRDTGPVFVWDARRKLAMTPSPFMFRVYTLLSVAQYGAVTSAKDNRAISPDVAVASASAAMLTQLYVDSAVRASIAREFARDFD